MRAKFFDTVEKVERAGPVGILMQDVLSHLPQNPAITVGRLVELLCDKGVLTKDDLVTLIPNTSRFEILEMSSDCDAVSSPPVTTPAADGVTPEKMRALSMRAAETILANTKTVESADDWIAESIASEAKAPSTLEQMRRDVLQMQTTMDSARALIMDLNFPSARVVYTALQLGIQRAKNLLQHHLLPSREATPRNPLTIPQEFILGEIVHQVAYAIDAFDPVVRNQRLSEGGEQRGNYIHVVDAIERLRKAKIGAEALLKHSAKVIRLEAGKEYTTRCGHKANITSLNLTTKLPFIGKIDGGGPNEMSWALDGRCNGNEAWDIVGPWWPSVTPKVGGFYNTRSGHLAEVTSKAVGESLYQFAGHIQRDGKKTGCRWNDDGKAASMQIDDLIAGACRGDNAL